MQEKNMTTPSTTVNTVDIATLKNRLKATWESGDYGHFSQYMELGRTQILDRLNVQPGTQMLDVACGAGQFAAAAARRGAAVTGVDIAANLVAQAREHARAQGAEVRFDEGDAEDLPYPDSSFDLVVSLIGAMFAPRPERVAAELIRVCRPGGRIVMANWTPEGFVGRMFKTIGKHVPPPPMPSPLLWGDEQTARERLGTGASEVCTTRQMYPFRYPFGPAEVVELFRRYYGPSERAFAALDEGGQAALRADLEDLWSSDNQATDGTTAVDAEYLEVVAVKEGAGG
jgi:SAM-dependent methyltransferase